MRPKKQVLVFGCDEDEISRLGYVLWLRKYAATVATSASAALAAAAATEFELAIVMGMQWPHEANAVVSALKAFRPETKVIFVARENAVSMSQADVILGGPDVALLLERLRVLAVRRRGPKGPARGLSNPAALSSAV